MEERRVLKGNPVSKGAAKAEAYLYEPLLLNVEAGYFKAGKETEYWRAFKEALEKAKQELRELQEKVFVCDEKAADIFAAHLIILEDEDLLYEIKSAILNDRMCPELAIEACFSEDISMLCKMEDNFMAQRVTDLIDVKERLICHYLRKERRSLLHFEKHVIIIARDLLPSDVATLDRAHVKGIITEEGGSNSHVAMLAKSYQIPLITGVENVVAKIPAGALIAIDASTGEIIVDPTTGE